ncbi:flavin-containing monooxygenase [Falsiroseomonas sp. HW251]|uniref:flavin-containing monooxygenase n=1 Tax=Falsiroseomonas sp. HW251 TaxID=3390998 RepID=UPI003D313B77
MHAEARLAAWLRDLAGRLEARDRYGAAALFAAESHWRDMLAFTWSIVTVDGPGGVSALLAECLDRTAPRGFALEPGTATEADGIAEAWFRFETASGPARGHLRLRDGLAWTVFTLLLALKDHPEATGPRRPMGVEHGAIRGRLSWPQRRAAERAAMGHTEQPFCLVVGAGQGGLALGARLKRLGVPTMLVDRHARPGDAWRTRYDQLCLHDPVWTNHLPYLPFPESWPVFTPKDRMADWLDHYAEAMELDVRGGMTARAASHDPDRGEWSVALDHEGGTLTLRPRHLVIATGMSGAPHRPVVPGAEAFRGVACHSSEYRSGAAFAGRRCVVVGSNNSAHDIAADLWERGAEVTMLQRSATTVVRSGILMRHSWGKLYSEEALAAGITTEQADMTGASRPFAILPAMMRAAYDEIRRADAPFYAALQDAGFLLDFGEDGTGHGLKYFRRGSGYYIDVGASELIIDGHIALRAGVALSRMEPDGVVLDSGERLPADLVVFATGFEPMERWVAELISPEVAARVGRVWGLGSDTAKDPGPWHGELRNMWKPTRQDGLWMMGGNLLQARFYSRLLAMQIKARLEGIATPVFDPKVFGATD